MRWIIQEIIKLSIFHGFTVGEAESNRNTEDIVESSGRSDLFSITVVYEIWTGISNYFDFWRDLPHCY